MRLSVSFESQRLGKKLAEARLRLADLATARLGHVAAADGGDQTARRELDRLSNETEMTRREIANLALAVTQWKAAESEAAASMQRLYVSERNQ